MKKSAPSSIPARDMANSEEFVSRFGTFMRRTGADELPQLLNIFAGQMSFVGPRPLMTSEKVLHRERAARGVYRVRPGLAGLAQINCEKIESVKDKAELDAEYVEKMSFSFDVRHFFKTFVIFLRGRHVDEHFSSPSE